MGMSGSELLQSVRDILNEPTAGFWTDAQLYRYLSRSYERWFNLMSEYAPGAFKVYETMSYTGGEAAVSSSVGASGVKFSSRIISVHDITDGWPGDRLMPAVDQASLLGMQSVNGTPTHYFAYFGFEEVGGTDVRLRTIALAPIPQSSRSLAIFCKLESPEVSIDAATTDSLLPTEADRCVVLDAARMAARQDKDYTLVDQLGADLFEAKRELMMSKALLTESESVVYDYDE